MTLTKRSEKGSALTYGELDDNFTHLGGDGTYHDNGVRVGGYRPGEIIEQIASSCRGETVTVQSGTYTMPNVTGGQLLTTTYEILTGSQISYTPPAGTKKLIYDFEFKFDVTENSGISHYALYYDGGEVIPSVRTYASNFASTDWHHANMSTRINFTFDLNAPSNNASVGEFQEPWTTPKVLEVRGREYTGSYEVNIHGNTWWNGTGATAPYNFSQPLLKITAIA